MPVPACLLQLQNDGRISASAISGKMMNRLRMLLDSAVIEQQTNRRGSILAIRDKQRFSDWITRQYPLAESEMARLAGTPRARAVAAHRNTKHGISTHSHQILLARSPCIDTIARVGEITWPIGKLTNRHGIAACLISNDTRLALPSPCMLVENQEVLMHCELILPDVRTVLYSMGKLSNILIKVLTRSLAEMDIFYHLPDYDPTGLSDYERLCKGFRDFSPKNDSAKPCQPRLFVPKDFDTLLAHYGNEALLQKPKNRARFEALSEDAFTTHEARQIFESIHRCGKVLEQEALLVAP